MRKLVLVIVGIGLLAACGSTQSAPAPEVTKTVEVQVPAPAPAPAGDDTAGMVDMVRAANSMFNGVDDAQIIETAYLFCDALRAGTTFDEIGAMAEDTIGVDATAALGAGAIIYLCPDQEYKVQ